MKENEKIEWESWGTGMRDGTLHRFGSDCPHCQHDERNFDSYIIGFSNTEEYRKPLYMGTKLVKYQAVGIVIIECPKCLKTFYSHIHQHTLEFVMQGIRRDPDFLKAPGAKEELLKMLKEQEEKKKSQR